MKFGIYAYNKDGDSEDINFINKFVTSEIDKFILNKRKNDSTIDENALNSERNKIIDYVHKMLKVRKSVVEQVSENIKQKLIDDYCTYTQSEFDRVQKQIDLQEEVTGVELSEDEKKSRMMQVMNFSPRVADILYRGDGLKNINYKEYVQYTKREYQINALPKAVYKAVKACSNALVRTRNDER